MMPSPEEIDRLAQAGFKAMFDAYIDKPEYRKLVMWEDQPEDVRADWRTTTKAIIEAFRQRG